MKPEGDDHRRIMAKHGDHMILHLLAFFWNHHFGSNLIENVVCSLVQAAGRVTMGGKVLQQL